MATLFRCDRCEELFDKRRDVQGVDFPLDKHYNSTEEETDTTRRDLCRKCIKAFWEWMNVPKITKQARMRETDLQIGG